MPFSSSYTFNIFFLYQLIYYIQCLSYSFFPPIPSFFVPFLHKNLTFLHCIPYLPLSQVQYLSPFFKLLPYDKCHSYTKSNHFLFFIFASFLLFLSLSLSTQKSLVVSANQMCFFSLSRFHFPKIKYHTYCRILFFHKKRLPFREALCSKRISL